MTSPAMGRLATMPARERTDLLVDPAVAALPHAVVGSGLRRSKLVIPGAQLAAWPGAVVVEGLGRTASG